MGTKQMKYHFNVYIEVLETDVPRGKAVNTGVENQLAAWITEGLNSHFPVSHRNVEVVFVETFEA